jgi:large subunit ribosomal protein L4
VLDAWGIEAPSTKAAKAVLDAVGATGRVLAVLAPQEEAAAKSLRNLPNVQCILNAELNAYDVLCSDVVVFTPETLPNFGPKGTPVEVTV